MDEQAAAIAAAANAPHGQRASLSRVLAPLVEPAWRGMLDGLAPFFEERRYANGAKSSDAVSHAASISSSLAK